jgi:hypothetical protein
MLNGMSQIFVQVLNTFPTRLLLSFATVSHRVHDLVVCILHQRLLAAASLQNLQDHKLILECYHPSAKLITPGVHCDYIGTDAFNDSLYGAEGITDGVSRKGSIGELAGLYSHFRPVGANEVIRTRRRRYAGGDMPGQSSVNTMFPGQMSIVEVEIPSQIVSLESHELFSQLCTAANLVKMLPNRGLILSCHTIGEGVIRVWRDWLAERAGSSPPKEKASSSEYGGKTRMLWLDHGRNIGIQVRVLERADLGTPVLWGVGEDAYVSYSLEYEGELLHIHRSPWPY